MSYAQFRDIPAVIHNGTGGRISGMGNAGTAASNDVTSIYWNPGALASNKRREVQAGAGFNYRNMESEFSDRFSTSSGFESIKFDHAGLIHAVPVSRGGFSFGIGVFTPWIYDNEVNYRTETTVTAYRGTGRKLLFSGGMGVMLAPGLGAGFTASVAAGPSSIISRDTVYNGEGRIDTVYDDHFDKSFTGFDLRAGIEYTPVKRLSFGLRFTAPSILWFDESRYGEMMYSDNTIATYGTKGKITSEGKYTVPLQGSFGISAEFPFALVSADLDFRAPEPDAEEGTSLSVWKLGCGFGAEVPLGEFFMLRGGYAFHELDQYPFYIDKEGHYPYHGAEKTSYSVEKNEHRITSGLSVLAGETLRIGFSYNYLLWEIETGALNEKHNLHTAGVTISLRY